MSDSSIRDIVQNCKIAKGDFFTVVQWLHSNDNSYKGDCFEVRVVDLPYIRAFRHTGWGAEGSITLNLDQVEIMPLSDEFVADVMGNKKK
jgi:hypothetical protein